MIMSNVLVQLVGSVSGAYVIFWGWLRHSISKNLYNMCDCEQVDMSN